MIYTVQNYQYSRSPKPFLSLCAFNLTVNISLYSSMEGKLRKTITVMYLQELDKFYALGNASSRKNEYRLIE